MGSQRFLGVEGRKNRGKGGAMELARVRVAGRFWHAKHLYKDCAPKGGNCLHLWHGWKLLDLSRLVKVSWGRGLLFFGWGMGDRVAGLPEGTFSGSIDFQNAFAMRRGGVGKCISDCGMILL